MILAGDIGGTKTNLAWFDPDDATPTPRQPRTFRSADHAAFDAILDDYLREFPQPLSAACFGIAGPILDGRVETPNLPWIVAAAGLAERLGLASVGLINDLEATAYGIDALHAGQLHTLSAAAGACVGNRALIAAGTGLGVAGLYWDGRRHHPLASEGGHADFAPRNRLEIDLLLHLERRLGGRVSYERVLSGPGLVNIHDFLRQRVPTPEHAVIAAQPGGGDSAASIAAAAINGQSALAAQALDLFVDIYGAMAGNLALHFMATGGLYIGGGIAPKILSWLAGGAFIRAFQAKGRMSSLLASMPVHVILDDRTALIGAARHAIAGLERKR